MLLTDGQSWNFYLPGGLGTIEERLVYSLHLDERSSAEAEEILHRYLSRERIVSKGAFEAAREDQERAINQRKAGAELPKAWAELVADENELLVELLQEKVEALCGFRPSEERTLRYPGTLTPESPKGLTTSAQPVDAAIDSRGQPATTTTTRQRPSASRKLAIDYSIHGDHRTAPNASRALVDILRTIVARDPSKID